MHMRTKKWAKPELAVCPYFTNEAERFRGQWRAQFECDQPLYLELGCGKGVSTAVMIHDNPQINYVAVDITCNVLGDTRRNIAAAFGDAPVKNAIIARYDISYIEKVFAPEDRVERIYINLQPVDEAAQVCQAPSDASAAAHAVPHIPGGWWGNLV